MKIQLTSVFVDDQDLALEFYIKVLGFVKRKEIPVGEFKWLTVVSPENSEGTELALEPSDNPAVKMFKAALFRQGIPITAFLVDDLLHEVERLKSLGVRFTTEPTDMGPLISAVFDDTCGNLIQLYQEK